MKKRANQTKKPPRTPARGKTAAARSESYWLPDQEKWINDFSRIKLMVKCRRLGGSHAEAFCVAEATSMENQVWDAWVGSRDLLAARLFNNDVKKFARPLNMIAADHGEVLLEDGERDLRAFEIEFANGRMERALSSSPDAFAGKQGRFSLDEFALHKDPRQLYSIVQPALIRGGSLSIISTHRGTANFFNELVKEIKEKGNPKRISYHEVNIEQAVQQGLWRKIQENLKNSGVEDPRMGWSDDEFLQSLRDECATEEAWKQEYMCTPCDDSAALLTWEELLAASLTERQRAALLADVPKDAPRFVGMDVGRRNHPSVIWQWVKHAGLYIEEDILPLQNMDFEKQERLFIERVQQSNTMLAAIDETGLGMQMAENAAKACPGKVLRVTFNQRTKLEMAVKAKRKWQDRVIRHRDKPKIQYELYSIKQQSGSRDAIVITSEQGLTDGHADYAWAGFLGLHAADVASDSTPISVTLC